MRKLWKTAISLISHFDRDFYLPLNRKRISNEFIGIVYCARQIRNSENKEIEKKNISIVFFSNVYISAEEGTSKCFPKCIGFWRHFVFGWLEKRIIILLQTTHHARSFGTLIALLRPLLRCRTLHQFNENLIYAFQRNVKQNLVRLQPMPSVATQCDPLINSNHLALKTL